jgi:hypothetical protein
MLELETHLHKFIFAEFIFVGEGLINHPVERDSKRIDIAFIGVSFFKSYLRRCSHEGSIMLFVKFLCFFEQLLTESKICYFQNIIIDKNILRFDVSMDDIKFIEILKGIEYLLEILKYIFLLLNFVLLIQQPEVAIKIFIIAIL